jgi:hypothetical protein
MPSSGDRTRVRVDRGIYRQPNGKYAVCVRVDGRARFRTLEAATIVEALKQRQLLQSAARVGELPLSPRLTFAEVAGRWLAEFEVKVAAGERRERTLELYRSQLRRHLLPRLGRRRLALVTVDDVVAIMRELRVEGLSPWTIKRILGALSCVLTFALRRGYISAHPFDRLERDERPHPLRSDQRVLTQTELGRLLFRRSTSAAFGTRTVECGSDARNSRASGSVWPQSNEINQRFSIASQSPLTGAIVHAASCAPPAEAYAKAARRRSNVAAPAARSNKPRTAFGFASD